MTVDRSRDDLPPFWIVSLVRATERRAFVSSVYAELGVQPVVIDAVDGQQLTDAQLASYSELHAAFAYGRGLSRAEIAVALSHLAIYRRMVEEQVDEVVVLEDDVRPTPELLDVLAARSAFPADFDLVTLHSLFPWATPTPVSDRVLAGAFRVCRYARTPMGTQAYLVRRPAAARLLDIAFPVRLPADELLFRSHPAHLAVYGIEPSPVRHDEFPSELHSAPDPPDHHSWWEAAMLQGVQLAGRVQRRLREMPWLRSR